MTGGAYSRIRSFLYLLFFRSFHFFEFEKFETFSKRFFESSMGLVLAVSTSQVSNIQMFLKCYGRNDAI